jgi:hypothetical protein
MGLHGALSLDSIRWAVLLVVFGVRQRVMGGRHSIWKDLLDILFCLFVRSPAHEIRQIVVLNRSIFTATSR